MTTRSKLSQNMRSQGNGIVSATKAIIETHIAANSIRTLPDG